MTYSIYNTGNNSYSFSITQTNNYSTAPDIWQNIGSAVFSGISYSGAGTSLSSGTLTSLVNSYKGSYLYLGAFSEYEYNHDSYANLDLTLTIDYTPAPTQVTITADNNFTDNTGQGTHGSVIVDGNTYTAPYNFTRYTGTNVTLQAVDNQTDNQGRTRVFMYWLKNGQIVSTNQTYSFTVSSSDNGTTYQAAFRQLLPPKISYFTQSPDPLYNGGTGYVYVYLSQGNGQETYSWYPSYSPSNITFTYTPQGNSCQIHYYTPFNTLPTINLTCVVSNSLGTDVQSYQVHCALYPYQSVSENGKMQTSSLAKEIPSDYSVNNYPNPFNPTTKINYQLPVDGLVSLKVYDILGREVATLVNDHKTAGYYSVDFNASNLSSGIYIYRITANNFTQSKKMLLMK